MIQDILVKAVENNASDVFISAGKELCYKINNEIIPNSIEDLTITDTQNLITKLYELAHRDINIFKNERDDDFSLSIPGTARFRINTYFQRGSMATVIRVVKFGLPDCDVLNIPDSVMDISKLTRGLALITGPAGSGKSTTLACIIDKINSTRKSHIITIEDPIEYLHRNKLGIVSQRELSMDTHSYIKALRASLREAPDVILVGEMRDLETIRAAITAAETGHLVLSTLHTLGAANTIDRIIDMFPPEQQQQIRVELAQVLKGVVSQQLLPVITEDGVIPAFEVMNTNNAIKTLIRENRIHQIDSSIQTSAMNGMISMDDSILNLYKNGKISKETAIYHSVNTEQIKKKL